MPLYDYHCENCDSTIEVMHGYNDQGPDKCQQCLTGTVKKMPSSGNFQLKGTGWYVTDFKDKKPKESNTKEPTTNKTEASKTTT